MDTGVKLDHVWFDKDRTVNFKAQINTTYCGNGETMVCLLLSPLITFYTRD